VDFVEINGSHEGGGQIVRSAITLSCVTKKPVHIEDIRRNRKIPGLRPQHVAAVKMLQKISNAKVVGNEVGSTKLKFIPKEIKVQTLNEDVGTAGSVSLILQTIIPLATILEEKLEVRVKGGTDVLWSPTINYSKKILKEALRRMGLEFSLKVIKRGYFPKGGGEIKLKVFPSKVTAISFSKQTSNSITMLCTYSNMSREKVSEGIKKIAKELNGNLAVDIKMAKEEAIDSGSSLLVYAVDKRTVFGMDSLFDKKSGNFDFDAEGFLGNSFAIDENLADMLVVPASLAAGKTTFEVREVTSHLETNLFVASTITGCRYGIGKIPAGYKVIIEGVSHSSVK